MDHVQRVPDTARSPGTAMKLRACYPTRSYFRPGESATVRVRVSGTVSGTACLHVSLIERERPIFSQELSLKRADQTVTLPLPARTGVGYGVKVDLIDAATGRVVDHSETALDVQSSWADAPRYGFLCSFSPGEQYGTRSDQLLVRHITVVQFYDWMYRHYQFLPPSDIFIDALGRRLSLASVRRAITAVHARGMAALAYGAAYGAEPEYAGAHPDEVLYDDQGRPLSLGGIFHWMDVRPGSWRDRILEQYRTAIRVVGFDGVHVDQYGYHAGIHDAGGDCVDMARALTDIVTAAQQTVVEAGGEGVIFNAVANWPLQAVASAPQTCTYIEVWPPYERLRDLVSLITNAKKLAPDRQVILAAYMSCAKSEPDAAQVATLLTSAVIHASGGFHLLLGEGTGLLADAYYPNFVRPGPLFQQRLVDHWNFIVRYGAYLFDRRLCLVPTPDVRADSVWLIRRTSTDIETLSLINADPDERWDMVKPARSSRSNVVIEMPYTRPIKSVFAASPDGMADAVPLDFSLSDGKLSFRVPRVDTWTLIVIMCR